MLEKQLKDYCQENDDLKKKLFTLDKEKVKQEEKIIDDFDRL